MSLYTTALGDVFGLYASPAAVRFVVATADQLEPSYLVKDVKWPAAGLYKRYKASRKTTAEGDVPSAILRAPAPLLFTLMMGAQVTPSAVDVYHTPSELEPA